MKYTNSNKKKLEERRKLRTLRIAEEWEEDRTAYMIRETDKAMNDKPWLPWK